jgi:hypothetical protein
MVRWYVFQRFRVPWSASLAQEAASGSARDLDARQQMKWTPHYGSVHMWQAEQHYLGAVEGFKPAMGGAMPGQKLTSASQWAKRVETQTTLSRRFVHRRHQRPQDCKHSVFKPFLMMCCSLSSVLEDWQAGRVNSGSCHASYPPRAHTRYH